MLSAGPNSDDTVHSPGKEEENMSTAVLSGREPINTRRPAGASESARKSSDLVLWFDTRGYTPGKDRSGLLTRALQWRYNGVICYPDQYRDVITSLPRRVLTVLDVARPEDIPSNTTAAEDAFGTVDVIASGNPDILAEARARDYRTCLRMHIADRAALERCIALAAVHDYVLVSFLDPTNIPLELLIATLQPTATRLVKEIARADDVDDAVVALGVMEVGSEGVSYTPASHDALSAFMERIEETECRSIPVDVATITRSEPLGMGMRSCIDTTTLMSPTEGLLVGSTSSGGILCCPEVFFLPYMELRPFRVNAGAVHSYVFNVDDRTDYMSELKAGHALMLVDKTGRTRKAYVGRVKTEVRPLRLIEAEFANGTRVNVILQDDWHVRVFSADGLPLNITHLKVGDRVLGYVTQPGRHVGIRVTEQILEK
jgi:3-dehydroquinate synthase II/3-amino-4-hydroxybenzoic acid synthase